MHEKGARKEVIRLKKSRFMFLTPLLFLILISSCGVDTKDYISFPFPIETSNISLVSLYIADNKAKTNDKIHITDEKDILECIQSLPDINPRKGLMPNSKINCEVNLVFKTLENESIFTFHYFEFQVGGTNVVKFGKNMPYEIHDVASNVYARYSYLLNNFKKGEIK